MPHTDSVVENGTVQDGFHVVVIVDSVDGVAWHLVNGHTLDHGWLHVKEEENGCVSFEVEGIFDSENEGDL